jgi:hypothetical protein
MPLKLKYFLSLCCVAEQRQRKKFHELMTLHLILGVIFPSSHLPILCIKVLVPITCFIDKHLGLVDIGHKGLEGSGAVGRGRGCLKCHHVPYLWAFFLGAFTKSWKATISFIKSVRLSVCVEQVGSHSTGFDEVWYLSFFQKSVEKIQV